MSGFEAVVYSLAGLALLTGAIDLALGLKGQQAIGARLAAEGYRDPLLNSQFRYLGAMWFGIGALLLLCLSDLGRYSTVLAAILAIVFLGGIGRLISAIQFGLPAPASGKALVYVATAVELIGMPLLLWWQFQLLP